MKSLRPVTTKFLSKTMTPPTSSITTTTTSSALAFATGATTGSSFSTCKASDTMASATTTTTTTTPECSFMALKKARTLKMPSREEMLARHPNVYNFWNTSDELLQKAWEEWELSKDFQNLNLPKLENKFLINSTLREAIEKCWSNPTIENERILKDLWEEVAPGVYAIQFLDMEKVHQVRKWFDAVAPNEERLRGNIPVRPPYGIVLNRKGMMTDPKSVGYVASPSFQEWYRDLIDTYVRPLGRVFFPHAIMPNDDSDTFSFSIQYQGSEGGDKSIRPHSDASTLTFNINFDETKTWTGSSLLFYNDGEAPTKVEWQPGYAVMHLGRSMHAAVPIESGTRSNFVIWTTSGKNNKGSYGGSNPITDMDGYYPVEYQLSPEQRWVKPTELPTIDPWEDRWSPF